MVLEERVRVFRDRDIEDYCLDIYMQVGEDTFVIIQIDRTHRNKWIRLRDIRFLCVEDDPEFTGGYTDFLIPFEHIREPKELVTRALLELGKDVISEHEGTQEYVRKFRDKYKN